MLSKELINDAMMYGGGLTGIAVVGLSILRVIGLRASKDALTIKEDGAHRDTIGMLQKRINLLDERVAILEVSRNKLVSFASRLLSFLSMCSCVNDDEDKKKERAILDQEFREILQEGLRQKV